MVPTVVIFNFESARTITSVWKYYVLQSKTVIPMLAINMVWYWIKATKNETVLNYLSLIFLTSMKIQD